MTKLPKGNVYSSACGWIDGCYVVVISDNMSLANGLRHIVLNTICDSLEDFIEDYYRVYSNCNDHFYPFATMDEVQAFIDSRNEDY